MQTLSLAPSLRLTLRTTSDIAYLRERYGLGTSLRPFSAARRLPCSTISPAFTSKNENTLRCKVSAGASTGDEPSLRVSVEASVPVHWTQHLETLTLGEKRSLRKYIPIVSRINSLEPTMQAMTDQELQRFAQHLREEFSARSRDTSSDNTALMSFLPKAFALVREASSRVLGLRHYDVQLLGGIIMAEGGIAEMRTGEGKTLVALLPAFLHALAGQGVHVVTVNAYLAVRDATWVGKVLQFLGLTVGVVTGASTPSERTDAFSADVTYITAHELSFTFLFDHMSVNAAGVSMRRPLKYAIVDEVDSILIDEARNPFIITDQDDGGVDEGPAWRTAIMVARRMIPPPDFGDVPPDDASKGALWVRDVVTDTIQYREFDFVQDVATLTAHLSRRGMTHAVEILVEMGLLTLAASCKAKIWACSDRPSVGENRKDDAARRVGPDARAENGVEASITSDATHTSANKTQTSTDAIDAYDGLCAVLLNGTIDGKLEVIVRPVEGQVDATSANVNSSSSRVHYDATAASSSRQQPWPSPLSRQQPWPFPLSVPSGGGERVFEVPDRDHLDAALQSLGLRELPRCAMHQDAFSAAAPAVLWNGSRSWGPYITQAIRAEWLYQRDVHYLVRSGEINIIDIASGREKDRSRWQAGLHQAVEAKEQLNSDPGVQIRGRNYDRGRVTYQSLFNCYQRLAGMTGTAMPEHAEFEEAYGLRVVRVPPHRPSQRIDHPAEVYPSRDGWEVCVAEVISTAVAAQRPVLLGTASVEDSEAVLRLVRNIPVLGVDLHASEVRDMALVVDILPRRLPPPMMKGRNLSNANNGDGDGDHAEDGNALTETERKYLAFYEWVSGMYAFSIKIVTGVATKRTLSPQDLRIVEEAARALGYVAGQGLMLREEDAALQRLCSVLEEILERSTLGHSQLRVNILNARPEAVRREAEIIAQAGLPGTVTVATAMAGRGTDILLGGNPKGLVLTALRYGVLPFVAKNAPDLSEWRSDEPPLAGLSEGIAFESVRSMERHMPGALVEAYKAVLDAAAQGDGWGSMVSSAAETSAWLESMVESAETDRSQFVLAMMRRGEGDKGWKKERSMSLENAVTWLDSTVLAANEDENQPPAASSAYHLTGESTLAGASSAALSDGAFLRLKTATRRYALLQWLWFDATCQRFAAQVRSVGGLVVVITSLLETRRGLAQLRGRAGRQGDPGETFMITSVEDSLLQAPMYRATLGIAAANSLPDEPLPGNSMESIIEGVVGALEQVQRRARDSTRKYDMVLESYRRHVFRLRRSIAAGGEAARTALLHCYVRDLAMDLVAMYASPHHPPTTWQLKELLKAVEVLLCYEDDNNGSTIPDEGSLLKHASLLPVGATVLKIKKSQHRDDGMMYLAVNFGDEDELARELQASLRHNHRTMPDVLAPCQHALPSSRRGALLQARRRDGSDHTLQSWISPPPASKPFSNSGHASAHGPYSQQVARLQCWLGDLLQKLLERKRSALQAAPPPSAGNALLAIGSLRLVERDAMLHVLDALWADFLHDAAALQTATATRSFSMFDPIDEYRLEISQTFAQLLTDFRREAAALALGPISVIEWERRANMGRAMAQRKYQSGGESSNGNDSNATVHVDDGMELLLQQLQQQQQQQLSPWESSLVGDVQWIEAWVKQHEEGFGDQNGTKTSGLSTTSTRAAEHPATTAARPIRPPLGDAAGKLESSDDSVAGEEQDQGNAAMDDTRRVEDEILWKLTNALMQASPEELGAATNALRDKYRKQGDGDV